MTTPSEQIDSYIAGLNDWRGPRLAQIREIIRGVDPAIYEEWKWMGSPVWELGGIICVGDAHKDKIKLTFPYGASDADPDKLFNNGFNGNVRRAIDIDESYVIDVPAFEALLKRTIAFNQAKKKKK